MIHRLARLVLVSALLAACGAPAKVARRATLSELVNVVMARASAAEAVAPASEGQVLGAGGLARTGAAGKVRLDLTEGTILRLAPQSEFTLAELNDDVAQPFTRLSLTAGQVWVILSSGALNVETPVGVATVRGSYLGVNFDPAHQALTATCLEGHCALSNAAGTTPLTSGQAAEVIGANTPPAAAHPMTGAELQTWKLEIPEAQKVIAMPTPAGTPPAPPPASAQPPLPTPPPLSGGATPPLPLTPLSTALQTKQ